MKRIKKKLWGVVLGAAVMAATLTGCGKEENTDQDDRLTISSFNNLVPEDFITAFHEVYPEVELEVISYAGHNGSGYAQHTLEHGDIPDIYVTSQTFSRESQEKYLLDLSNYDFVNNYSNALLDTLDVNGGIYLLPSGYQLTGIYYNKTILEENGWKVPQSLRELEALSEEIEAAGYRTIGNRMSLEGFPFNYFFNIGNTVYFGTPEGTQWKEEFPQGEAYAAGNTGLKEAAAYFNKWIEDGFITSENTDTAQFLEGECVFFLCLGLSEYEHTTAEGNTYTFGTIPWLSEDGSNNMLTRSVSRYMGINKSLAEEGQEKKLENALKLLDYVSTVEGQQALMSSNSVYMPSLNDIALVEDSPYYEISGLVSAGRTVPLVYVGWENLIVPIAQDIKQLIQGEIDVDELLECFDQTKADMINGSSEDVYAVARETLTVEQTARLVAVAEGRAVNADCAMISLNQYHGDDKCNSQGLGWYLYEGNVNTDYVNMVRPDSDAVAVLELTGAQIKEMRDAGFDLDGDGNPYEYLLFTRRDMELEDDTTYKLAVSSGELTEEMSAGAEITEKSPADAIKMYLAELGNVSADAIVWE